MCFDKAELTGEVKTVIQLSDLCRRSMHTQSYTANYRKKRVSASIIVNLPCQERALSAGQRLPHVIREDQKVSRGSAETLTKPRWDCTHAPLWHVVIMHYLSSSHLTRKKTVELTNTLKLSLYGLQQ